MISIQISDDMEQDLIQLCKKLHRTPKYCVKKALQSYIEDQSDLLVASERLKTTDDEISLEEIKKKYDL